MSRNVPDYLSQIIFVNQPAEPVYTNLRRGFEQSGDTVLPVPIKMPGSRMRAFTIKLDNIVT